MRSFNEDIYKEAVLHLKKHNPYLPNLIKNVLQEIYTHNSQVDSIDEIITNYICKNFPSQSGSSVSENVFYDDHIIIPALKTWYNSIKNTKDLITISEIYENIDKEINDLKLESKVDGAELHTKFGIIGRGNKNSADIMRRSFENLLKNEEILKNLIFLTNRRISLNKDVNIMIKDVQDISESIENGYYNKKLSCCPTALKMLRNYSI